MRLSFKTKFENEKPTYFIEKVWLSIYVPLDGMILHAYKNEYKEKFGKEWDTKEDLKPKHHTIRRVTKTGKKRWHNKLKIQFITGNRWVKNGLLAFAPEKNVVSVQDIKIEYYDDGDCVEVIIDNKTKTVDELEQFCINDGFESSDDFFEFFNHDFEGQIIHWTDLKY